MLGQGYPGNRANLPKEKGVEDHTLYVRRGVVPGGRVRFRVVYLTDRKSWRQKIGQGEVMLLARPETNQIIDPAPDE